MVTALLKTTRNEVTKIGWNPHLFPWDCFMRLLKSRWHTVSQTNKRTRFPDVTVYLHKFNDIKRGPSNYSILWKGFKLSFPLSTVLIKANKQKVWHKERTLTIESRKVHGLCEKLLPFIIQHYLLLGWPRIISQVLCLAYFQKSSSCTQNQLSKLKLWVFIISKDQLQNHWLLWKFTFS